MASYTAIAEAGASIIEVLRDNLTPEPIPSPDMIGLCSPAETGDIQLGLYLYSIKQNREYRRDGEPMLVLTLYYLLTAYSNADIQQRSYDENYILGAAIQVLHENSTLGSAYLQGDLGSSGEELRVDQYFLPPEEMQKIWIFPNTPYHTSVGYMVYPVIIDTGGFVAAPRVR
ncbi:MAG: Pvc16 family protein [Syntrophomonadaceae bacterium]